VSSPAPPGSEGFVRPARAGDADSLVRVQVASWRCGYAGIVPADLLAELTGDSAQLVWRDRWREAIGNPPSSRHRVLVAVTGGSEGSGGSDREVVGFVSAGPATDADRWPGTDGELYELRVAPERTGQGHGSRLLHAAADTLASDGFHTLSIWALEADSALLRFLESAGWAPDGARGELDVGVSVPAVRLHTRISE
jgi:GNAT superfamily N-acetyltransferase